jgi:hypothetical protein
LVTLPVRCSSAAGVCGAAGCSAHEGLEQFCDTSNVCTTRNVALNVARGYDNIDRHRRADDELRPGTVAPLSNALISRAGVRRLGARPVVVVTSRT